MELHPMSIRPKDYALTRKLIDSINNNFSIIHQHQLRKDNTKALKTIAIIASVYGTHKIFDRSFFDFLEILDSGKLNFIITQDIRNELEYKSFEKEHFQGTYSTIKTIAFMMSSILPEHKMLSKLCTGVTSVDDVVRIEFKQHKLTLLKYENKFRLLNLHNKQNKKTTWFKESFFDTEDEMFTYLNNIEEYAEYNGDVLEMIKY
jgi:hypothetical protein